ncbi:MAG: aminomethyl-transferring glycine dehydrogenase subunit GcvPA [Alphaproteobacteria bacterium]|nr:aminomethyl-transferring glycine dehydrogenase subunit GcvPA [Alphaproteobacteria bacterium]
MRYLPLTDADRAEMLRVIGVAGIDDLFADVPRAARMTAPLDLPKHAGEIEVAARLQALADRNRPASGAASFLGCGAYRHHVPASVDYLIQRGEFLTSYTPYQPEISQGTLQYLFEFQTQVALLTGMEIANASLYDGASAAAEAVLMARRITRRAGVVLSGALHPHWTGSIATLLRFSDAGLVQAPLSVAGDEDLAAQVTEETACVVVQNPDVFGHVRDLAPLAEACHEKGALLVACVAESVSLGALTPPGAMGADIVAGEGQGIGNGLNFGGPYLGLLATRERFVRQMPGRVSGETVDAEGRRGYVLTLSAREQHIRRERATSNICTNSGLCALAFTIHLALLGEVGFKRLARINHHRAVTLADRLVGIGGIEVLNDTFFNEFTLRLPVPAAPLADDLARDGIFAGVPGDRLWPGADAAADLLIVAATELNSPDQIEALARALEGALS